MSIPKAIAKNAERVYHSPGFRSKLSSRGCCSEGTQSRWRNYLSTLPSPDVRGDCLLRNRICISGQRESQLVAFLPGVEVQDRSTCSSGLWWTLDEPFQSAYAEEHADRHALLDLCGQLCHWILSQTGKPNPVIRHDATLNRTHRASPKTLRSLDINGWDTSRIMRVALLCRYVTDRGTFY